MPDLTYPASSSQLRAYLASPIGEGPWPGVVAIQDAMGWDADRGHGSELCAARMRDVHDSWSLGSQIGAGGNGLIGQAAGWKTVRTRIFPCRSRHLSLYDQVDRDNRAAFRKFLSGAPSGCEIVATYKNASIETAQTILSAFQQAGLPGPGVIGAEVFGDGFAIYIKGDFPEDAFAALTQAFREGGTRFGLDVEVASGRFGPDELRELP